MFHFLRTHRRLVTLAALATLVVWLSAVLAGCLLPSPHSMSPMGATVVPDVQVHEGMAAAPDCPQGICATMESDREPTGDQEAVPATSKLPLVALLLAPVLFIAANPTRDGPKPPEPLLPKRSPALRFYALRI